MVMPKQHLRRKFKKLKKEKKKLVKLENLGKKKGHKQNKWILGLGSENQKTQTTG